jgi:RNA polymerase subunit RPABC4/transcription elongation factor Spt4
MLMPDLPSRSPEPPAGEPPEQVCPVCGSTEFQTVKEFMQVNVSLVCRNCRTIFRDPDDLLPDDDYRGLDE